jgi:hypothetical protein
LQTNEMQRPAAHRTLSNAYPNSQPPSCDPKDRFYE